MEMQDNRVWEQDGIDFRDWSNVPKKDIACYEYAEKEEEVFPLPVEAKPDSGVPQGNLVNRQWESKLIYPGVKGDYWVYVPQQYHEQEAALMVFLDGNEFLQESHAKTVLDHLIHRGEIPVLIGIFINPGDKGPGLPRYGGTNNRSIEYDSIDDRYASFLEKEIFSEVRQSYHISNDPKLHAICGISSSGNAAFAAAWNRNDLFTKVLSHVGSFTNIRGGHNFPSMIRQTKKKDIRVYLQTGKYDLNTCFGDWLIANQDMASALEYKGYQYKLIIGPGAHSMKYGASILPDAVKWLWNEEAPEKDVH